PPLGWIQNRRCGLSRANKNCRQHVPIASRGLLGLPSRHLLTQRRHDARRPHVEVAELVRTDPAELEGELVRGAGQFAAAERIAAPEAIWDLGGDVEADLVVFQDFATPGAVEG